MKEYKNIFRPVKIGPVNLKNRIEVAPAAPFLAGFDGSVTPDLYQHTVDLARSGAAVVTLGVSSVDRPVSLGARVLSAGDFLYVSTLESMAEGIHSAGAAASIELVHSRYMLTPADIVANQLSTEEVEDIIRLFGEAAERCMAAGFDMVLIHGGHGNVPSMFYNPHINKRTDKYGGSFEKRCRFGLELLDAVHAKTHGKIAVEYRISADEMREDMTTFDETLAYAERVQDGIDLLHVSRGLLEDPKLVPFVHAPSYLPKAPNLPFAREFKKALHIPVSVVNSFDLDLAEKAIGDGDVDMVAMMRTIMADTRCVKKAEAGCAEDIRPCVRCNTCIGRTHGQFIEVRCAVNPLIGRQAKCGFPVRSAEKKNILVVGGGPGGMEAARTASARGFKVTLAEKSDHLGGNLVLASAGDLKKELKSYLDWFVRTVEKDPDIDIVLNTEVTRDYAESLKPDAIIVAAGSDPVIPEFCGASAGSAENAGKAAAPDGKVIWIGDAEGKGSIEGERILIAGAGLTGLEYALEQLNHGKQITVIDMIPREEVGAGTNSINRSYLEQALLPKIDLRCEVKLKDVTAEGAVIEDKDGTVSTIPCDKVVLSFGFRPKVRVYEELKGAAKDVIAIGDCTARGGNIMAAVHGAFDAVMQLQHTEGAC